METALTTMNEYRRRTRTSDRARDRGQLLVGGAVVLAFIIISLAFTVATLTPALQQNTSPPGYDATGLDNIEHLADTFDRETQTTLTHQARVEHTTRETAVTTTRDAVELVVNDTAAYAYTHHRVTTTITDRVTVTPGYGVTQPTQRNYTNKDGDTTWTIATTTGVRNYTMNVDPESLATADTGNASSSNAFRVHVTGDNGNTRTTYIMQSPDGSMSVVVNNATGDVHEACTVSSPSATERIQWTPSPVEPSTCRLSLAHGLTTPVTITYEHSDNITGTYHLIVADPDTTTTSLQTTNLADPGTTTSPRYYHAAYAVEYTVTIQTPDASITRHYHTAPHTAPALEQ